jgi:anti-sigma factor RsiW
MDNDNILKASNYADGEMDAQEQQEFELLLQSDAELREYVAQYRQAATALKANLLHLMQTWMSLNKHFR